MGPGFQEELAAGIDGNSVNVDGRIRGVGGDSQCREMFPRFRELRFGCAALVPELRGQIGQVVFQVFGGAPILPERHFHLGEARRDRVVRFDGPSLQECVPSGLKIAFLVLCDARSHEIANGVIFKSGAFGGFGGGLGRRGRWSEREHRAQGRSERRLAFARHSNWNSVAALPGAPFGARTEPLAKPPAPGKPGSPGVYVTPDLIGAVPRKTSGYEWPPFPPAPAPPFPPSPPLPPCPPLPTLV